MLLIHALTLRHLQITTKPSAMKLAKRKITEELHFELKEKNGLIILAEKQKESILLFCLGFFFFQ